MKNKKSKNDNFFLPSPPWQTPDLYRDGGEDNGGSDAVANIIETGSITVKKGGHLIHCLTVIGQIEGHYILSPQNKTTKYEHVIPQLVAIEESDEVDGLILILNTVGGDIEAGLAIAELVAGMSTPTVSLVLGRRSLDRRAPCRIRRPLVYNPVGDHDNPPREDERPCPRRAADPLVF